MRNLSFLQHFFSGVPRVAFAGLFFCGAALPTVAVCAETMPETAPQSETVSPSDNVVAKPEVSPKDERRYSLPLPLPEEIEAGDGEIRRDKQEKLRKESPQRKEQREQREMGLRRLMVSFGVEQRDAQDEIMLFIARETRARAQVRRQSTRLHKIIGERDADDQKIAAALQEYREALSAERLRRTQSENELNERLDFRNQPRLEAFLTLSGLVGDGPLSLPLNARRAPGWENRASAVQRPKSKDKDARPNAKPKR